MKNCFKKLISAMLFTTLIFTSMSLFAFASEDTVYVSKTGSDVSGNGTSENPYRTIEKAKEVAKTSSASFVVIKGGVYTVSDLVFDSSDRGVTYKGEGNVVITEAKDFSASKFQAVKNPEILKLLRPEVWGKVYEVSLEEYHKSLSDISLFIDGKKQNISRYPNMATSKAAGHEVGPLYMIAQNPATNAGSETEKTVYDNTFTVSDRRVSEWKNISDAYIVGSVVASYDWRKRTVENISESGEITASDYVRDNAELYICNLIEEIDVPGEYAYDSSENMLYVYMPENAKTASVVFKGSASPLIKVEGCNDLTFENIKFDKISKQVFKSENAENLNIKNCEFNYITANYPLEINGKNINIDSNKAYGNSGGFVKFSGGEVTTEGFVNGNISIKNNIIANCGDENSALRHIITCGTNAPEYETDSIGNSVENNVIYNCGNVGAIGVAGNNLVVKNNEIFNIVRHIHDGGAIYLGKSNVKVGNEVSNNYIHTLAKNLAYMGIYSDDGQGGITVKDNVIADVNYGMQISAGMEGQYVNNIFVDNNSAGMIYSTRMDWTKNGVFAQPGTSIDENGYARNQYGEKIFTLYGETKKALETYPNAYSQYSWLSNSLTRKPFFAPWNIKINNNIHYSNKNGAKISNTNGFYHTYLVNNNPVVEYEDEWLEKSGKKSEALKNGKINEIVLYNGEMTGNNVEKYSGNILENLPSLNTVGITDTSRYSKDFTFDFTPVYSDGKLKIVLDKSENLSQYNISLIKGNSTVETVEYFDDNGDTAYETASVQAGETYTVKIDGYGLARQNSGSYSVSKTFSVPKENDKTALNYVVDLLNNDLTKYNNGVYTYSDNGVVTEMDSVIASATALGDNATKTQIEDLCNSALTTLSKLNETRNVSAPKIASCKVSDKEPIVEVIAEDFEPNSQVSVVVTNPGYGKSDFANNSEKDVVRYMDVVKSSGNGDVKFTFNTATNGVDMPNYYKIYLADEKGRVVEEIYCYGSIETSDVSFFAGDTQISKDELSNYKNQTVTVTMNVNNRMDCDVKSIVYCGIYADKQMLSLASAENVTLKKNDVSKVSAEIKIPESYSEKSVTEIMIFDSETALKPLTVKKTIVKVSEE